jgi:excisionase family DNA binding protein
VGTVVTQPGEGNVLLDIAGAAAYLGVSEAFVRRLVLERRVRYYKVGKFVRFRAFDLDAFVEAGRRDPVEPWVPIGSSRRRVTGRTTAQRAAMPTRRRTTTARHRDSRSG